MKQFNFPLPALAALALAACQQRADDSNITIDNGVNAADPANAANEALPSGAAGMPATSTNGSNEADEPAAEGSDKAVIPAQYRGRWGMVAADCTSTRGDNKGLITVGDTSIRFYESTATLKQQRPAIATGFSGLYGFTGEGQSWEKVVTFTRAGDNLKRADDEGSYSYTRCT